MGHKILVLTAVLLAAPSSAFARGIRTQVPVGRANPAFAAFAAAQSGAAHSVGYGLPFIQNMLGSSFPGIGRPTLAGIFKSVQAYTAKLDANLVRAFYIPGADPETYQPSGAVLDSMLRLKMPRRSSQQAENIRFLERRRSGARPASTTGGSLLAEGGPSIQAKGIASTAREQLRLIHRRSNTRNQRIVPSPVVGRIDAAVSFDGSRGIH